MDGINLDDSIEEIIEQLRHNRRTRLPVFHSDINQVEAVLNTRHILHLLPDASLTREALLAIFTWAGNGPWVACLGAGAALLVFADYLPRTLASRYPDAVLNLGNSLLGAPLKIIYPAAWMLNGLSQLLMRPFTRKVKVVQQSEDEAPNDRHDDHDHEHLSLIHI